MYILEVDRVPFGINVGLELLSVIKMRNGPMGCSKFGVDWSAYVRRVATDPVVGSIRVRKQKRLVFGENTRVRPGGAKIRNSTAASFKTYSNI